MKSALKRRHKKGKKHLRQLKFENLESRSLFAIGGLISADPAFNQDPNAYGNFGNVDLPLLHSNPGAGAVIYMRFEGGIDDNGDYYAPMDFETKGTSTTSNSYSLGNKTFTTQAGLPYQAGYRIQIVNAADPKRYMNAIVNSYSGTTLSVNVDYENSSGSVANWTIINTHFNSDERDQIIDFWRQVSRHYSTYNVDVTTDWIDLASKPDSYVAITPRSGGVNFEAFPHDSAGSLSTDWPGGQAIIVHEVAHSFGVHHKSNYNIVGLVSAEYGTANSPIYYPMMGGAEDWNGLAHMPKFIYGQPNNSSTTGQDDLATISSSLTSAGVTPGRTTEPDLFADFGNTIGTAFGLPSVGTNMFGVAGIISTATDIDYFSFSPSVDGYYDIMLGHDVSAIDTFLVIQNASGTVLAAEGGNPWDPNMKSNVYDQHITRYFTAGTYYIRVSGEGNYADIGSYVVRANRVGDSSNPWRSEDVGFTNVPGYASFDSATGTYSIAGAGSDLLRWMDNGTNTDNFHFLAQQLQGSGYLNAKITGINGSNVWSEGGVMIRASLDPQSDFFSVALTKGQGWRVRARISGALFDEVQFNTPFAAKFLSVERVGNTYKAYISNTGLSGSWTQIGSTRTINMGTGPAHIGLFSSDVSDGLISPLDGFAYPLVQNQRLAVVTASNIQFVTTSGGVMNPAPYVLNTFTPPTLTLGTVSSTFVGFSWNNVASQTESGYILERSEDGVNYSIVADVGATTFTHSDSSNLYGYGQYFYRIRARKSDGTVSNPSNVLMPVTRASAVTGIYPSINGTNAIVLKWDDVDGDTGYKVYRSTSQNGTYTQIGSTLAQNRTLLYDSAGKSANTTYWYKIETLDEFGAGGAMTAPFAVNTRWTTSAPTGLTNPSKTATTASLNWSDFSGAVSYMVYRGRQANGAVEYILAGTPTTSDFNDSGLDPGVQYTYRVLAVNSSGRISANTSITVTTPGSLLRAPSGSQFDIARYESARSRATETVGLASTKSTQTDDGLSTSIAAFASTLGRSRSENSVSSGSKTKDASVLTSKSLDSKRLDAIGTILCDTEIDSGTRNAADSLVNVSSKSRKEIGRKLFEFFAESDAFDA